MASINGASDVQGCCFFPPSIQEEIFSVMQNRFSNILYHRCSPVSICRVFFSQLNQTTCSISVKDDEGTEVTDGSSALALCLLLK
jgi:hypothetical protein